MGAPLFLTLLLDFLSMDDKKVCRQKTKTYLINAINFDEILLKIAINSGMEKL